MLCLMLLVFALAGRCRGGTDNSSTFPMLLLPPVPASRRMSDTQVHSLRRQLMRDNYDYEHSVEEGQPNNTARRDGDTKFYYQKGGIGDLQRASELSQTNSNAFSAESGQQEHYRQRGQFEQRSQHEQNRQHDQPGEYEHHGQHEQRGLHEQGRYHKQPSAYEHIGQYEQPDENEQRGQYEQHGPHEQRRQPKQHGQQEEHEQHEQRGQNEQRGPNEQRGQDKQREHSEQQAQLGQFDKQEQSTEQKPRTAPSLDDEPVAPPVAVPFTDELTVRELFEREHSSDQHVIEPNQAKKFNPSNKRPFSDLRGNYKEQYGQNDAGNDMRAQEELASNVQESPDQEYTPNEQEAFDQQDASGSQDDEGSDVSASKKEPKIHNEFVTHSTTHATHLQHYTPATAERNAPLQHVHNSLSYRNSRLQRSRNAPTPHRNAQPPQRSQPPPHHNAPDHNAPDHNISKKDLLYYMDDSQLRRRKNDASPDVPDENEPADDQLPSPQPSPGLNNPASTRTSPGKYARRPAPTEGRSGGELPRTSHTRRSFVVTVSAANVTYKLLTLKSRSGRRQNERRILEERGPAGVAIMSLDHAPLPAFRLPRARRQYMHASHHHRHHEPA